MAWEKEKKKMMTIRKDNKWVVLSLFKSKDDKIVSIGDVEHSNPLFKS